MVKIKSISDIELNGGLLCLDFINSVASRKELPMTEYLNSMHDLIEWGRRLKIIDAKTEKLLTSEVELYPKKAIAFFKEAIYFRELLYSIYHPISSGKIIPSAVLKEYNAMLSVYFSYLRLKSTTEGFEEDWTLEETSFKRLLAPILNDSYENLLSNKLHRIKECPNCGWLFYDSTKNGKRRWCSMKSCGSGVKALNWYYRQNG